MEAATVARRPAAAAAPARAPRSRPRPAVVPRAPSKRQAPARRPGGQLIPIAVGTASAVGRLPDTGLIVRLTRGRAWIGVLGVLLAGIVALNVVTLSLAASAGHVDQNLQALLQENSLLRSREARLAGVARVHSEAAGIGLSVPQVDQIDAIHATRGDAALAARRLAAAGAGY
jgi:hypothetical protein